MERFIVSDMKDKNFSKAINEIYLLTDYNKRQYPEYYKWYYSKNVPRIFDGSGEVIFYLDGFQVVSLAILKKNITEKKICTLLIDEEYRRLGYSKNILEDSFDFLETDKPVITIPKSRISEFSSIIDYYHWNKSYETDIYYNPEIVFNEQPKIKRLV